MAHFWNVLDNLWLRLASVRLTLVLLIGLGLLAIPGTLVLQYNISNVDPALQYEYDFFKWGEALQLFTAYQSFWYVGLLVLLSMNLIACSTERWPQMLKLARAKPVKLSAETFERLPKELTRTWNVNLSKAEAEKILLQFGSEKNRNFKILEDNDQAFQIFWQTGQWSRIANYLVHISLLVIFAGGIVGAMYGFEGGANIPAGSAVDTFLMFKEGKASGLIPAPGGLSNERLLGFRLEAESFDVRFYENFPNRAREYVSKLNVLRNGQLLKSAFIRVNEPLEFENFTFYQASYGRLGDFNVQGRVINKANPLNDQVYFKSKLGQSKQMNHLNVEFVPIRAVMDIQGLGPGVQFLQLNEGKPQGSPFWVLKDYPEFDYKKREDSNYAIVVDDVKELFFTGLQIAYDPGAPIYWLGCLGMLIGTFYALFVTHQKFYVHFESGKLYFSGQIHRLPFGFEAKVEKISQQIKTTFQSAGREIL